MTDRTKAVFVESASNPDGIVADLEAIAAIAHAHGVPLVVDNTLPTPYLCQPLRWGATSSSTR
jgi:O-acetylhomoserine (thiol)-lyase